MRDCKSPVGIYVRVSTSGQSTHTQEAELRQYARRRGWHAHRVYADRGYPGSLQRRPALDLLLSATEAIDTTVASGELVFGIIASMAQFERSLLGERVKAGMARVRKLGKHMGRPAFKRLMQEEIERVRRDRASGKFSLRGLVSKYGTSLWTMQQLAGGRRARA